MTQDEIIEMLREAAGSDMPDHVHGVLILHTNDIDALIKLVASKEREACALVCKEIYSAWACESDDDVDYPDPHDCMRAIRARGET